MAFVALHMLLLTRRCKPPAETMCTAGFRGHTTTAAGVFSSHPHPLPNTSKRPQRDTSLALLISGTLCINRSPLCRGIPFFSLFPLQTLGATAGMLRRNNMASCFFWLLLCNIFCMIMLCCLADITCRLTFPEQPYQTKVRTLAR